MPALDAAPNTLGSRVSLGAVTDYQYHAGRDVVVDLLGQIKGKDRENLRDILAPAYRVAPPAVEDIQDKTYWDGQSFLEEAGTPEYFQERSTFLTGVLDQKALKTAFDHLRQWPGTYAGADLRFFQTGGEINAKAPDATAYVHRDNRWIMLVGLNWQGDDAPEHLARNHDWQDAFYADMLPFSTRGAYQNFADPSLRDWANAYYGPNFHKLRAVKASVDPDKVFRFPQAIPPAR